MKIIGLTNGKYAIVDDEDYEGLSKYKWYHQKGGKTYYAYRKLKGCKPESMHHVVLCLMRHKMIDHKNTRGYDNRRSNLRRCTKAENSRNANVHVSNTSGYKGVYWNKHAKRWYTRITYNGDTMHLGAFTCLVKAAKAYDTAARKYFKEFARCNFRAESTE